MTILKRTALFAPTALLALMPFVASAHETQIFEINHNLYKFVVGSLNEPVMVDDKTGVDLRVSKVAGHMMDDGTMMMGMNHDTVSTGETPIEGLEKTLQVELKTGTASNVLDLSAVYGSVGAYKAPFYPTAAVPLTYRIFGTLDGNPIDVSFSCNPAGHNMTATTTDTSRVNMGNGIVRVSQKGAYGCPAARDVVTFPDVVPSEVTLAHDTTNAGTRSSFAIALSLVAITLSVIAYRKRRLIS